MAEITSLYSDGDVDTNRSGNRTLHSIVEERYSRRQTIRSAVMASTTAFLGTTLLAACGDDEGIGSDGASVVDAGDTITTSSGRAVVINGSLQGSGGSVQWTQTGGPAVALTGATTATPSFIAPSVSDAATLTFSATATGSNGNVSTDTTTVVVRPAALGFAAVAKNRADIVTVPEGYTVTVMTRLGDPIAPGVSAYSNDGTDTNFAQRIGDHGDALYWYGLNAAGTREDLSNTRGLMVQNHENLNVQYLHPNGPTGGSAGPRPAAEAVKEIEAHGVSITEYVDTGNRTWTYNQNGALNRRITPNTPMAFNGPVRGSTWLRTVGSPAGTTGRGTINNCANGHTMWGTNLTCEENWAGYFRRPAALDNPNRTAREVTSLSRYGVTSTNGNYAWWTAGSDPMFARWNAVATGASAAADYRNEPFQFGWVVEIDPYDPASTPRKRTALGRMGHEGAWLGRLIAGQKLSVYMGDDSRGEYFYKYVSNANWTAADAQAADRLAVGDKYLDDGTLYVARFNPDGTGTWLPLVFGQVPDRPAVVSSTGVVTAPAYTFADQADVLVNTRLAADAVGATPMDRPEWTATDNVTGEIYLTLTNNTARGFAATDAANPRYYNDTKGPTAPVPDPATPAPPANQRGNPNGHILRLRENGDDPASTTFRWDIYLFGADSAEADAANVNLSGLVAENDFSSPDGLWFSRPTNAAGLVNPLLWIQTDDGAFTDKTNNQMLAALPGTVGDGGSRTITNSDLAGTTTRQQTTFVGAAATVATLRRFLTGPRECEITGVDTTPDGRTLFVGIQHPGEDGEPTAPSSNWPQSQGGTAGGRPRSAIVAITKNDGGIVGL